MKNRIFQFRTVVLFAIGLIALSCNKDWLDVKPRQDIAIPTSLKDFQALLDNSNSLQYGSMNVESPSYGIIQSDEFYMTDASYSTIQDREKNAYTWSYQFPNLADRDWSQAYSRIAVCNIILEGLAKEKNFSSSVQGEYNDIKGQALFQRARAFFELAQIWSPPYNELTASTDLSIPLRLNSDVELPSARSNVQETYDRIANDLLLAKDLLPISALYKTRGSKTAVLALLARVFLSMEKYNEAGNYANECLKNYNSLIDYAELNTSASAPIAQLNKEVIFHSTIITSGSVGSSRVRIDQNFKNLYSPNDLRGLVFFGTSGGLITFKGNYTSSTSLRFNGLATDEMYLIRAECFARDNKIAEAMKDLNDLLKKRWKKVNGISTYVDESAIDAEDALKKILLERRKELLMRGVRWSDLRRLNKDNRFKLTLSRTVVGQTYKLEPNSNKYTFPIPDDIINMTGMIQNPGWN